MTTQEITRVSPVEGRVRCFYQCLNAGQFQDCFQMIDPPIREKPHSVTLHQYAQSLKAFLDYHGGVEILKIELVLHADEPSVRFHNRNFAMGKTWCKDRHKRELVFLERWVNSGSDWYTVCTGFVTPDGDDDATPR